MLFGGWVKRRRPLLAIGALCLSGCGAATPDVVIVAPPLPAWPAEAQAEVADEIEACADCDATLRAIGDYIGLRDAVRAASEPQGG